MNQLIKVNYNDEIQTISARELHSFLEVGTHFKDWFPRMCEYGFSERIDFCSILSESTGGRPSTDYQITIDMAKELCMIQRTEKGKQARQYFIEIEKQWNSPESIMSRALKLADKKLISLQTEKEKLQLENKQKDQIINELQPKATYYDLILQSKSALSISQIAKDYGMSAQKMNDILHNLKVQYCQNKQWLLYNNHSGFGYTTSKTHHYVDSNNEQQTKLHTYWTQKGRLFIYDLLKNKKGIVPIMEREQIQIGG